MICTTLGYLLFSVISSPAFKPVNWYMNVHVELSNTLQQQQKLTPIFSANHHQMLALYIWPQDEVRKMVAFFWCHMKTPHWGLPFLVECGSNCSVLQVHPAIDNNIHVALIYMYSHTWHCTLYLTWCTGYGWKPSSCQALDSQPGHTEGDIWATTATPLRSPVPSRPRPASLP